MDKTINFEQNIKELEDVVRQLEGGDVSLDELLVLFEKGVGLAKTANSQLDNAEQKINMLIKNKSTGEMEEVSMDATNDDDKRSASDSIPVTANEPEAKPEPESIPEIVEPPELLAESTEPPKPKGAHFVAVSDDIPPMPESPLPLEEDVQVADEIPLPQDAPPEPPQQAMIGFDDL